MKRLVILGAALLNGCSSSPEDSEVSKTAWVIVGSLFETSHPPELAKRCEVEFRSFDDLRAIPLSRALESVRGSRVIIISDGDLSATEGLERAVTRLAQRGASVSAVCVATPRMDPALMNQIAEWGGGRFHFVSRQERLENVLENEARR